MENGKLTERESLEELYQVEPLQTRDRLFRILIVLGLVTLIVINLGTCTRLTNLEKKRSSTLVQQQNGEAFLAQEKDAQYRSPETVTAFIKQWLPLAFNWSNKLPNGESDPGQSVLSKKIPSGAWLGSFALAEPLRAGWLETLIKDFNLPSYLVEGNSRVLMVRHIGEPQNSEAGIYRVTVIGDWVNFKAKDQTGERFEWNKVITMEAIEPSPEAEKTDTIETAIYSLRSKGLLITSVEDFK